MRYRRMPIEVESPEQLGYETITNNLSESSVADRRLGDLGLDLASLEDRLLCYGDHLGDPRAPRRGRGRRRRHRRRRRARHAGRGRRALRDGDRAPRAGRSRRGRAHQLRDEPRDAARDRRRSRRRRSHLRERLAARRRSDRGAVRAGRDAVDLRHVSAQPDRDDVRPGDARSARRSRGTRRRGAARRRDVPRPDLRRAPSTRRVAVTAGHQRRVDVEGVRVAGPACRLGGVPRRGRWPRPSWPRRNRW